MNERKIKINLVPFGFLNQIRISQHDSGYNIYLNVYDGKSPADWIADEGNIIKVRGCRADGYGYIYDCTVDGSIVSFTIDEYCSYAYGKSLAELRLTDGSGIVIGSANFVIDVEQVALPDDAIMVDDIPSVIALKDQFQVLADSTINTAKGYADSAAASAQAAIQDVSDIRTEVRNMQSVMVRSDNIHNIVEITRSDYEALENRDTETLYIIEDE